MNDIRRVLRAAAWRIMLAGFLRNLVVLTTAAIGVALVARMVQQSFGIAIAWERLAWWSVGVVVGASAMWSIAMRPRPSAIARRVDEGADLRETLSTALHVALLSDGWSRNVLETAAQKARTVNVARAVPIRVPRSWPVPLTSALTLLVVWILFPSLDLLGKRAQAEEALNKKKEVDVAKVEAKAATQKVEELLNKLDPAAKEADKAGADQEKPKPVTPEEVKRAALKSLESMKDKIEALKNGEKAQMADALKDMMKQLKTPGPGPMADVASQLAQGKFDKAAEALEELSKQLAAGNLSAKDKEQLSKNLESLKDQLQKVAEQNKQLQNALEKAGVDKNLAKNSEALAKALEKANNLTPEQKQALVNMAKAQESANEACKSMGSKMGQMAKCMNKDGQQGEPGMSKEGQEAMKGLSQEMSQAEMMASEAQSIEAAMSEAKMQMAQMSESMGQCDNPGLGECKGGLGDGIKPWQPGESTKQGNGTGGQGGYGNGKNPNEKVADENWQKRKVSGATGDGPIIGTMLVQGESVKGESRAQFQAEAEAAQERATEALENNVIPREYHDAVKHYFGRLSAKSKGVDAPAKVTAPTTGSTPAAPAKSDDGAKKDGSPK